MNCSWLEDHSEAVFKYSKTDKFYCKDKELKSSSCFFIDWPEEIIQEALTKDPFIIFIWKQKMKVK